MGAFDTVDDEQMSMNNDPHRAPPSEPACTSFPLAWFAWSRWARWRERLVSRLAWGCSAERELLPFFARHCGANHLDVSVNRGFYLPRVRWPHPCTLTLLRWHCDPAGHYSRPGRRRVLRYQRGWHVVEHGSGQPFDAISLFALLHTLPGGAEHKEQVLAYLAAQLHPDGVLVGATVLGKGVRHNLLGRLLLAHDIRQGRRHPQDDDLFSLQRLLRRRFDEVDLHQVGRIALFAARRPVSASAS